MKTSLIVNVYSPKSTAEFFLFLVFQYHWLLICVFVCFSSTKSSNSAANYQTRWTVTKYLTAKVPLWWVVSCALLVILDVCYTDRLRGYVAKMADGAELSLTVSMET